MPVKKTQPKKGEAAAEKKAGRPAKNTTKASRKKKTEGETSGITKNKLRHESNHEVTNVQGEKKLNSEPQSYDIASESEDAPHFFSKHLDSLHHKNVEIEDLFIDSSENPVALKAVVKDAIKELEEEEHVESLEQLEDVLRAPERKKRQEPDKDNMNQDEIPRNMKNKEKINSQLAKIYENKDGSMPDMKYFEKRKRNKLITAFFTLIFSCIFVGVVAYFGFFILQSGSSFSEESVSLSIEGLEKVNFNQDVRYRIRYRNDQRIALNSVVLQVRYPEGFQFEDSTLHPENDTKDKWTLGRLEPFASGYIDVFGKMHADAENRQSFRVFLNYFPQNFSSEFQKVSHLNIAMGEAPMNLEVSAPEEVVVGDTVDITLKFNTDQAEIFDTAVLELVPNGAFSLQSSSVKATPLNPNRWFLFTVSSTREMTLSGIFTAVEDFSGITFSLRGWSDKKEMETQEGYVFWEQNYTPTLLQTDFVSKLVINGGMEELTVEPGEVLNMSIFLKNEGKTAVKNADVELTLDGPSLNKMSLLKWEALKDENGGDIVGDQLSADLRRGVLSWDKRQISKLGMIEPGEEVIIDMSLPIKSEDDIALSEFVLHEVMATLKVEYEVDGEVEIITQKPLTLTVNSDLNVEVRHDVDIQDPTHTLTWLLTNSFHELKDIEIEMDLYGQIDWNEDLLVVPAGKVEYDPNKQRLVWRVDSMPTSVDVLALQFGFRLDGENPTQTNLTSKIKLQAMDVITGKDILKVVDGVKLNIDSTTSE